MKRVWILLTGTALTLTTVAPAIAADIEFNITKQTDHATAKLMTMPTKLSSYNLNDFELSGVLVDFDGVTDYDTIEFYSANSGGGFSLIDKSGDYLFSDYSEVLFTGPTSEPTFKTGSFATSPRPGNSLGGGNVTIAAVPESSSWAMLIAGFGVIGSALRRRHQDSGIRLKGCRSARP